MPGLLNPFPRGAVAAVLTTALIAATGPAIAQDTRGATANIAGDWSFWTEQYDINPLDGTYCSMTGELTLRATGDPDIFAGELTAYESCRGQQIYEARQTAVATRSGDALTIVSTLERVLPSPDTYQPDDFELTIIDGSLMRGDLRSADIAPVTFERRGALVS